MKNCNFFYLFIATFLVMTTSILAQTQVIDGQTINANYENIFKNNIELKNSTITSSATGQIVSGTGIKILPNTTIQAGTSFSLKIDDVYTVTFTAGPNGSLEGSSSQYILSGQSTSPVSANSNTGYNFLNWSDSDTSNPRTINNVSEDISVTANFVIKKYDVIFNSGEHGTISGTANQQVDHGLASTSVTVIPSVAYNFVKWSDDNTDNPRLFSNVTENKSVTAEYELKTYSIVFNAGAHGTLTGESAQTVNHGSATTEVSIAVDPAYTFLGWDDGNTDNPRIINPVTEALNLTAQYEKALVIEFGQISVDSSWQTISLTKNFTDPVIVIGPPTDNDADFVTVRIKNKTATSFDVRLQEWEYLDDIHANETVSYMVVERGRYLLSNGKVLEADSASLSNGSYKTVSFENSIASSPIVLSSIVTENDTTAVTTRVQNVSNTGFQIKLQEEEGSNATHSTETIDWVAVEETSLTIQGSKIEIKSVSPVDERNNNISLNGHSLVIGSTHTVAGGDPGVLRMSDKGDGTIDLRFEEEQAANSEVAHANETAGVILVTPPFPIEFGIVATDHNWQQVNFSQPFTDPILVVGPHSKNDPAYSLVRVKNLSSSGFEVKIQEWDYLDGAHGQEDLHFMVVEKGRHTLPNGKIVEAGEIELQNGAFSAVNFSSALPSNPALFSSVVTDNDQAAVTRRIDNVSTTKFDVRLQEEEGADGVHGLETVHYIAIEKGGGTVNNQDFVVDTVKPVDERVKELGFSGYEFLIASDQDYAGSDPGVLRMQGTPQAGVQLIFEEEQSKDSEVAHADETAAYIFVKPHVPEPEVEPVYEISNIHVNHEWITVPLNETYTDPVVIAGPLDSTDVEPALVRIKNISPTSFDIRIQEFDYQDGTHGYERVSYMVVERGSYKLPGGKRLIADSTNLSNSSFSTVSFSQPIASNPIILSSVATENDTSAVFTRIRNINSSSFEIRLQEEENNDQNHSQETVNYIAIEQASISLSKYDILTTSRTNVKEALVTINETGYDLFLADQITQAEEDASHVRMRGDVSNSPQVYIEEEQSKDTEIGHTNETVAYLFAKGKAGNSYNISFVSGTNGVLTGSAFQNIAFGGTSTSVGAVPSEGYHFVEWSDGVETNPRVLSDVSSDATLTAIFAINQYTVSFSSGANGSLTGNLNQTINHGGSSTSVEAVPSEGYHFVEWSDGVETNPRVLSDVSSDATLTANFAINQYTVSFTSGTNGSLTGNLNQTIAHGGSSTSVQAVASEGYHFVQWNDGNTSNPRIVTNVTSASSYTAEFAINQYSVVFASGPNGSLSGNQNQTVIEGQNTTSVTAVPDIGYTFVQWSDGNTDNPRIVTNVSSASSYTAEFTINQYSVVFTSGTNGSLTGNLNQTINHGQSATIVTAVPAEGYHLVEWSDGSEESGRLLQNIQNDILINASFAINTYEIAFIPGENGSLDGEAVQTVNHGASTTSVLAVPLEGYEFTQWSDGSTENPRLISNVTESNTLTASFVAETFLVEFISGDNGSLEGEQSQNIFFNGDTSEVTALPAKGYLFDSWNDGEINPSRVVNSVQADQSYTANFILSLPILISHKDNEVLTRIDNFFTWAPIEIESTYTLNFGTSPGQSDIAQINTNNLFTNLSYILQDGSTVYLELISNTEGVIAVSNYSFKVGIKPENDYMASFYRAIAEMAKPIAGTLEGNMTNILNDLVNSTDTEETTDEILSYYRDQYVKAQPDFINNSLNEEQLPEEVFNFSGEFDSVITSGNPVVIDAIEYRQDDRYAVTGSEQVMLDPINPIQNPATSHLYDTAFIPGERHWDIRGISKNLGSPHYKDYIVDDSYLDDFNTVNLAFFASSEFSRSGSDLIFNIGYTAERAFYGYQKHTLLTSSSQTIQLYSGISATTYPFISDYEIEFLTQPKYGTVSSSSSHFITYTPTDSSYVGPDSFQYRFKNKNTGAVYKTIDYKIKMYESNEEYRFEFNKPELPDNAKPWGLAASDTFENETRNDSTRLKLNAGVEATAEYNGTGGTSISVPESTSSSHIFTAPNLTFQNASNKSFAFETRLRFPNSDGCGVTLLESLQGIHTFVKLTLRQDGKLELFARDLLRADGFFTVVSDNAVSFSDWNEIGVEVNLSSGSVSFHINDTLSTKSDSGLSKIPQSASPAKLFNRFNDFGPNLAALEIDYVRIITNLENGTYLQGKGEEYFDEPNFEIYTNAYNWLNRLAITPEKYSQLEVLNQLSNTRQNPQSFYHYHPNIYSSYHGMNEFEFGFRYYSVDYDLPYSCT